MTKIDAILKARKQQFANYISANNYMYGHMVYIKLLESASSKEQAIEIFCNAMADYNLNDWVFDEIESTCRIVLKNF